jgi:predicted transcriptional regulator
MTDLKTLLSLPDRAVALYFTMRELETASLATLSEVTGKSQATLYRGIGELRDAGLIVGKRPKPKPEPRPAAKPRTRTIFRVYALNGK